MGPATLSQVLRQVNFDFIKDKNLLIGLDTADDAIVYKINEKQALIQSVDFFTPVVDDPYLYGQIAASNALSDIYAMGGKPKLAMNIVCFPSCLEEKVLVRILEGGADKVGEAGAIIAGGHTVKDDEPKYGLSVTGIVHPEDVLPNTGAEVGDKIIITKAIGTGIIATAIKGGLTEGGKNNPAVRSMLTLNDKAVEPIQQVEVNACTDVTGFGLIGHALEMARGSGVEITINSKQIPLLEGAVDFANMGMVPGGTQSNREAFGSQVNLNINDKIMSDILFDPQTAGGLLISVSADNADKLLKKLQKNGVEEAAVIGEVTARGKAITVL